MSGIELAGVRSVAGADLRDATASAPFWGSSAFLFLVAGLAAVAAGSVGGGATRAFLVLASDVTAPAVPVIGLAFGWTAVSGDAGPGRAGGRPHSRSALVVGTALGRAGVFSLSALVGFGAAGVVAAVALETFSPVAYAGFLGLTILYGVAYVAVAVSVVSLTRSTVGAAVAVIAVFLALSVGWSAVRYGLWELTIRGYVDGVALEGGGRRVPDWALFLESLDPGTAYRNALAVVGTGDGALGTGFRTVYFPDGVPVYLRSWASVLVLLAWIAAPVAAVLARSGPQRS